MDKLFFKYLTNLGFETSDINELVEIVPGLDIISYNRVYDNVQAVVDAGFPEIDIDGLIFANPGFLCNDPEYLRAKLVSIGGDIEEKLKDNPYII